MTPKAPPKALSAALAAFLSEISVALSITGCSATAGVGIEAVGNGTEGAGACSCTGRATEVVCFGTGMDCTGSAASLLSDSDLIDFDAEIGFMSTFEFASPDMGIE